MTFGVVYAALGRFEEASPRVERSFEERACWIVSLGVEPAWEPLRGNPRFEAVIAKVGILDHDGCHHAPNLEHSGTRCLTSQSSATITGPVRGNVQRNICA